jgi:hypothetical protein
MKEIDFFWGGGNARDIFSFDVYKEAPLTSCFGIDSAG